MNWAFISFCVRKNELYRLYGCFRSLVHKRRLFCLLLQLFFATRAFEITFDALLFITLRYFMRLVVWFGSLSSAQFNFTEHNYIDYNYFTSVFYNKSIVVCVNITNYTYMVADIQNDMCDTCSKCIDFNLMCHHLYEWSWFGNDIYDTSKMKELNWAERRGEWKI